MTDMITIQPPTSGALSLIRPVALPSDLIAFHDEVAQLIQKALKQDVDYGIIPGTGDKPVLLKPGAERINLAFGASPEYEIIEKEIDHEREFAWSKRKKQWNNKFKGDRTFSWVEESGTTKGIYRYVTSCRLVRADGRVLATGIGSCSTMESKYIDRPRDCENTVLKMAQKRAYVAATLNAYGLSNRFTQDVEEFVDRDHEPAPPSPPPSTKRTASIYTGTPEQQDAVRKHLVTKKVPEEFWPEVDAQLRGKLSTELNNVIQAVREGATTAGVFDS